MIGIEGLHHLAEALAQIDLAPAQQTALGAEAERLVQAVRTELSRPPGADHAVPWLRTGALRDSIDSVVQPAEAEIGSSDPVAVFQELGTRAIPPRPFLAPVAAAEGGNVARSVAQAVVAALREVIR